MAAKRIWVNFFLSSRVCRYSPGGSSAFAIDGTATIRRSFCSSLQQSPSKQEIPTTTVTYAASFARKTSSPLLMVPPAVIKDHQPKSEEESDKNFYFFFSLSENKVIKVKKVSDFPHDGARCVGSSHGWLAFSNPHNNSLSLINPFLAQNPLPNLHYHFTLPPLESDSSDYMKKLVLSSDPHNQDCIAAAIIGPSRKLAFCKPAAGDKKWTFLEGRLNSVGGYGEIFYSNENQCFYGTNAELNDMFCGVEAWDLASNHRKSTLQILPLDHPFRDDELRALRFEYCDEKRYLVESSGELLMVSRLIAKRVSETGNHFFTPDPWPQYEGKGIYKTYEIEVYRWDQGQGQSRFEFVESLDDRALFVGLNHSFSLSAREYTEMKENVVYYADDNFEKMEASRDVGGHDSGYCRVFGSNSEHLTALGCYEATDIFTPSSKRIYPPPVWVHP